MFDNPGIIVASVIIIAFVFLAGLATVTKIMINKLFEKLDAYNKLKEQQRDEQYKSLLAQMVKVDTRQRAQIFALKNMNSEWTGFAKSFSLAYRDRHDKLVMNPEIEDD